MRPSLKIFVVALTALTATSLVLFAPMLTAYSDEGDMENCPEVRHKELNGLLRPRAKHWLTHQIIHDSEPVEVEATIIALIKRVLIVNVNGQQLRIHLPPAWTIGFEVVEREDLLNNGFIGVGQEVTIKALKATLTTGEGYGIYLLFGYEITNSNGIHAFAVLPFNIETEG